MLKDLIGKCTLENKWVTYIETRKMKGKQNILDKKYLKNF